MITTVLRSRTGVPRLSRTVAMSAARRRDHTSADAGLQALHYGAVRAQIKVTGRDASVVAARDADKVRVWLSRR